MGDSPLKGISASLRDASLYPKEIGRRRVTLEEVHAEKYPARRSRVGEFMEVRVLDSFVVRKNGRCESNFILADETGWIAAIAFCDVGKEEDYDRERDLPKIYIKLKVNIAYRLHHFKVEMQNPTSFKQTFLLRNQVKRINLSSFVKYIENIPSHELEISRSFKKHIPFAFTKFDEVDRNLDGKLIDLVAFVKNIHFDMLSDGKYQRILQLSRTLPDPSNSPMKITTMDKHLYLRVYERFVDIFLTKEACYVFSNVKVKDCGSYGLKLVTTVHSIIQEIPLDNLKVAFPEEYKDSDFIAEHKYDTSFGSNADESQGSDDLCLNLSQLERPHMDPKVEVELSLPPHAPVRSQVQENPLIKAEPMPSLVTSTNPGESRTSPNKRTHSSSESTATSPPKKLCPCQSSTEVVVSNASQEEMTNTPEEFYDCLGGGYPYEVTVKAAASFKDTKPGEAYSTRSEIRGVALIINNVFDGAPNERRGTHEDLRRLKDLFEHFGFKVFVKNELPTWQLRDTIQEVKDYIKSKKVEEVISIDSLFVAVLSHGEMGAVEFIDGVNAQLYNDLIHPFDEENFSDFKGKPKVFVVQTCQGHPNRDSIQSTRNVLTPPKRTGMKNIIVCQGACPGQYSYRNPKLGAYMIYVLVFVMMRNAHDTHFEKMLKLVQIKMDQIKFDLNKELTCTWMPYQFKKLYFNPGLFEKRDNIPMYQ